MTRLAEDTRRRRPDVVLHVVGLVVAVTGAGMALSGLVDLADRGPDSAGLAVPGVLAVLAGLALFRRTTVPDAVPLRTVFSAVAAAWVGVSVVAAVPYVATGAVTGYGDALFEAVSGFTTTGATVLVDPGEHSAGLLFFRALTQWLGGLGVVVLAVAVLPFVGAGGMSLLRSEIPGHSASRLAPRVRDTARRLWGMYVAFTAVTTVAYALAGMSVYDATAHAFTSVSTGGFSTRAASIGAFGSVAVEWVAVAAMFLAGTNFVLLYRAVRGRAGPLLSSVEWRAYVAITAAAAAAVTAWNLGGEPLTHEAIRSSVFSVVSISSTTGFFVADFGEWVTPAQSVLIFLMLVGAMSGSTAGGSKIFRLLTAVSYARREVRRHVHPRLVGVVRLGREVVPETVVARILGYHALFLGLVVLATVAVAAFEVDIVTSVSTVAATLGNVGPGLGGVSPAGGYLDLPSGARWVTMALMLLGRLEIYPVLLGAAALFDAALGALPKPVARAVTRRLP